MESLQLKRTVKSPLDSSIKDIVLKNGENLIAIRASNYFQPEVDEEFDPEKHDLTKDVSYMFTGDGKKTISQLYSDKDFVRLFKYQFPGRDYIYTDAIRDGAITEDKLSKSVLGGLHSGDDINTAIDNYFKNKESNSISKIHFTTCTDTGPDLIFTLREVDDNYSTTIFYQGSDQIISYSIFERKYLDGLMIIVNFTNSPTGTVSNPLNITVKNKNGNKIKMLRGTFTNNPISSSIALESRPIYAGNTRIDVDSRFYWKANSTVAFVFDASKMRFNLIDTDLLKTLAQWCDENNTTYINGGMIATGTVTANQIKAGSITADKIATGAITLGVLDTTLSKYFDDVLNGVDDISSMKSDFDNVNRTAFIEHNDPTGSQGNVKKLIVKNTQYDILFQGYNIDGTSAIRTGANIIVKFDSSFTQSGNTTLSLTFYNEQGVSLTTNTDVVRSKADDSSSTIDYTTALGDLCWTAEGNDCYRMFTYADGNWRISKPASTALALAKECAAKGMTYIKGGTVLTGRIVADEIEANSITASKINIPSITPGVVSNINSGSEKISGTVIENGTITTEKIKAGAITSEQIRANSITSDKISAGSITSDKIAAGAITAGAIDVVGLSNDIVSNINSGKTNTISGTYITPGSITTDQIRANSITSAQIAANSITSDKLEVGTISAEKINFSYAYTDSGGNNKYCGLVKASGESDNVPTQGIVMYSSDKPLASGGTGTIDSFNVGSRIFVSNAGIRIGGYNNNNELVEFSYYGDSFHIKNWPGLETADKSKPFTLRVRKESGTNNYLLYLTNW